MKLLNIALLAVLTSLLFGCSKPKYDGFVYPKKNDLFNYSHIGEFDSPEACRAASLKEIKRIKAEGVGYYQCGEDCTSKSGLKSIAACKKMIKLDDRSQE